MTFEDIVIKFLEYAQREWSESRTEPERFYDKFERWYDEFERWFDDFRNQPQPRSQERHDCHQLCKSLSEHFNDEYLPLVSWQCVEARRYVEENAAPDWIQVPAEEDLLLDLRSCLEKKGISSWSDDSGALGIFPQVRNPGGAEDVMRVVAILVPLTQTLSTPGIYPTNFKPDSDCQAALNRALDASVFIVSPRRTLWPAILFILAGDWFPWSLLRVVLRLIKCTISFLLRGIRKSWAELLQHSKVHIAVTGARMGNINGPSIALAACMAILDALHRIPKAQKPPVLPIQIERLVYDKRAFTGNLTGIGLIEPVGFIGPKLGAFLRHRHSEEMVLPEGNYQQTVDELTGRNVEIESSSHSPRRRFRIHTQGKELLGFFDLNILLDKLAPVWNWKWAIGNPTIVGIFIALIIVIPPYFHPPIPVITGGRIGTSEIRQTGPNFLIADEVQIGEWNNVSLKIDRNGYKGRLFVKVIPTNGRVNRENLEIPKRSELVPVEGKEAICYYKLLDTTDSIGLNMLDEKERSVNPMFLFVVGQRQD